MTDLNRIETAIARYIIRKQGFTNGMELSHAFRTSDDKIRAALDRLYDLDLIDRYLEDQGWYAQYGWAHTDEAEGVLRKLGLN